jgi:hypothetical protein
VDLYVDMNLYVVLDIVIDIDLVAVVFLDLDGTDPPGAIVQEHDSDSD